MNKIQISVSVLAAELIDLKKTLSTLDSNIVDFIHLDIMDGHFVPQLSFGEAITKNIKDAVGIALDVHLMVDKPEIEVPKYFNLKPEIITFHIEATNAPIRLSQIIRHHHIKAGVALCPATPIEVLEPLLNEIDLILLMSVEPGYYGQKFIEKSLNRIKKVKELISNKDIILEVDGGINLNNINEIYNAGAGLVVTGAASFTTPNVNSNIQKLKLACEN